MPTCVNCSSQAAFNYEPIPGSSTLYCGRHLPTILSRPERASQVISLELPPIEESVIETELPVLDLPTTADVAADVVDTPAPARKTKATTAKTAKAAE